MASRGLGLGLGGYCTIPSLGSEGVKGFGVGVRLGYKARKGGSRKAGTVPVILSVFLSSSIKSGPSLEEGSRRN